MASAESNQVLPLPSSSSSLGSCNPGSTKTVLRFKRRLVEHESPSQVLVMSYKRCKHDGNIFDLSEPEEEISRVFRLAGTIEDSNVDENSIAKTIKDALVEVEQTRRILRSDRSRSYKRRSVKLTEKVQEENKKISVDNRFRVVSKKRGITDTDNQNPQTNLEPDMLFNLLDLVEENESISPGKKEDKREIGSITLNGIPLNKEKTSLEIENPESSLKMLGYVFDLYVTAEGVMEDQIQDQFVRVRHADADYEFDLDQYKEADPEYKSEEDDSNDEDNWRNDYPDSDPDKSTADGEGFAYGHDEERNEELIGQFSRAVNLRGNDLSSDDDADNYVYSTNYDGLDDGLGGMYNRYKSRLRSEELNEVVSSLSGSEEEF